MFVRSVFVTIVRLLKWSRGVCGVCKCRGQSGVRIVEKTEIIRNVAVVGRTALNARHRNDRCWIPAAQERSYWKITRLSFSIKMGIFLKVFIF
jgi:hypothetical protein